MAVELWVGIIIEPMLWSLFTYFSFMIIVHLFDKVTSKIKRYVVISSVLVFFIVAVTDIMNFVSSMVRWYSQ